MGSRHGYLERTILPVAASISGCENLPSSRHAVRPSGSAPPPFLIIDEPTNHLDINSIGAVEAGLRAYDGALLIVSHDEAFRDAVGISRRLRMPAEQ
jgi:ABC-type lipoprotein export system ATPase subunit